MTDQEHDAAYWHERRIAELEARESAYRERLTCQHTLSDKLQGCSEALQRLLRNRPPSDINLAETMHAVALLTGQAMQVTRASTWILDADGRNLRCRMLLVDGIEQPSEDLVLSYDENSAYVQALRATAPLGVTDAQNDPRTLELHDYLQRNDVRALLDIAVVVEGELVGVLCLEHTGSAREWYPAEVSFASHLGSLIALGVEAERRVQAESAAKEVGARYRHLVESLPVAVYSMDTNRRKLTYLSPKASELGDQTVEEWLKRGPDAWLERIDPRDRPEVIARYKEMSETHVAEELTYRVQLEGKGLRWIRDTSSLVRDAHGDPMALQGILADVTEQREAELAHAESERRARSFLRNIAMAAIRLDAYGNVLEVNPYFTQMTGYHFNEIVGKPWYDFAVSPDEGMHLRATFEAAMRVGSIAPRAEYDIRTKSGETRKLLWTRTLLKSTSGRSTGLISVGMDLTERLRLEAEVNQQAKMESLGQLASAVAHDFNNMLTVIINQVSFLGRLAENDERAQRARKSLDTAITQATELTQSLLVYSRKTPGRKQLTDVDGVLQELAPLMQAMVGKNMHVVTSLRAPLATTWVDPTRLRQVVLNLTGNAAHASTGHGNSVRLSTHVEFVDTRRTLEHGGDGEGEYVVVSVEDDGRGMNAATMKRIFDPFFTTKREGEGTGLGLAICQSVVHDAGGFIEVKSELGMGTRISVFFPRKSAAMDRLRPAPLQSDVVRAPRVLFLLGPNLDHDLAVSVREAGYSVAYAATPTEALSYLGSSSVDVLVLDAELGQVAEVLPRSARALQPAMRVVGIELGVAPARDQLDCDIHLHRPVYAHHLIEAIDRALQEDFPSQQSSSG